MWFLDRLRTQLTIKKQKLEIIQATERQLKKVLQHAMSVNLQEDEVDAEEGASALQQIARNIAYYFLILFGLFQDIAGSFIFGTTLFGLIPGIAQPFLTIAAIIYTALDSILFYAFEVSLLKDALGIPYSSNNLEEHIDAHRQQLKLASTINDDLSTLPAVTMDPGLYEQYTTLAILFNQDLRTQDAAMSDYQESVSKTILKVFLVTFGALSSIAASYFWADSIMSLWAASIIGTPIGWAMIALTVIAGLGYYYAMGGSSMVQLVNPDYENYQELRQESAEFRDKYSDDLQRISAIKKIHHRHPTREMDTQTDPIEPRFSPSLFRPRAPEAPSAAHGFRLQKPFALMDHSML